MEARMGGEPAHDRRMLVGAIVVADQMQLKSRIAFGQRFQEGDEFDVGVALEAPSMDLAAGHLQRGEQAGGAVARVVVSHTSGQSGPHRQRRLRAIKRLNLGLFIHAQHQGLLRWVQIEPDDIGQLPVELGVAAELEALDPVRLQPVLLPDAMDRGRRKPDLFGQPPCSETTIAAAIAAASAGDIISITDAVHSEAGIVVSKDLTIQGQGVTSTAVDGGGSGGSGLSVFSINSGVTATIQDMTIRDGFSADGGGILNGGTLTLSNSTLSGNSSTSPGTASGGGGIFNNGGTVTISNSTLSGNSSPLANGGGIFNAGTLTISNSTLSGNSAGSESGGGSEGGGIYNDFGTVTISFSTISGNSATLFGGGIFNLSDSSGAMTVKNSIVGNSVVGGDCTLAGTGTLTALGANLDTDGSCGTTNFTKVTSAQLDLGLLMFNGGTTETLALLPGSLAIDAAPDCTDAFGNSVITDQRGFTRPDNGESACDIGAFEFVDPTPPFASFTGKLGVTVSTGSFDLNSSFKLGAGSSGINPVTQAVTLQIGPYSVTIPAGSFTRNKQGAYVFEGVIMGVSLQLKIDPAGANSYTLQAEGSGANLSGISNPVTVTLTIGDNTGSTQIKL